MSLPDPQTLFPAFRKAGTGGIEVDSGDDGIFNEIYGGEYDALIDRMKPGAVVVDVGAQIGIFARRAAEKLAPDGSIYAFEPERTNYAMLAQNATAMPCTVTTMNVALWDSAGSMTLYAHHQNKGMNTLVPDSERWCKADFRYSYQVQTRTLDSFQLPHVDFIKIDVEAAESRVIGGSLDLIKRCRPQLIFEIHSSEEKQKLDDLLNPLGYAGEAHGRVHLYSISG